MAETTTRDRIADLRARGLTVREISQLLGISTQAIYKHLKVLEEETAEANR